MGGITVKRKHIASKVHRETRSGMRSRARTFVKKHKKKYGKNFYPRGRHEAFKK